MTQSAASHVVRELLDLLDAEIVAVIGHAGKTSTVSDWRDGRVVPEQLPRLAAALDIAEFMRSAGEHRDVIDAWFRGHNSALQQAPAIALADAPLESTRRDVMAAAAAFISR